MSNMSEGEITWFGRILVSTTKNIQPWVYFKAVTSYEVDASPNNGLRIL